MSSRRLHVERAGRADSGEPEYVGEGRGGLSDQEPGVHLFRECGGGLPLLGRPKLPLQIAVSDALGEIGSGLETDQIPGTGVAQSWQVPSAVSVYSRIL